MTSFIDERYQKFQQLAEKYGTEEVPDKEIIVKCPDGKEHSVKAGTLKEIAKQIVKSSKIYNTFIAAKVDDKIYDLSHI